jgi:hypothetical protein
MLDPFVAESVRISLNKMFRPEGYFDISALRTCLRAAGVVGSERTMDELAPLHCVHWSEMTPTMRHAVAERVLELFQHEPFTVEGLNLPLLGPEAEPKKAGWGGRLLGLRGN